MKKLIVGIAIVAVLAGTTAAISSVPSSDGTMNNGGEVLCTADASGFCTVQHDLGVVPTDIQVTPKAPSSGGNTFGQAIADQATVTSFRVRALRNDGTPLANTAVRFWWHVFSKSSPTTTTAPPTTAPPTTAPPTTAPPTTEPPTTAP